VADLTLEARAAWWRTNGHALSPPIYSLVTLPDIASLSFSLFWTYARLAASTPDNDGMLRVQDQVVPSSRLLGIVNADHLTVAIPHPGSCIFWCSAPCRFRVRRSTWRRST
jgi:hypothetical protein